MENQNKQETTIIVRRIPVDTYKAFKATCAIEGVTVQQKIAQLMKQASAETVVTKKSKTVYNPDNLDNPDHITE